MKKKNYISLARKAANIQINELKKIKKTFNNSFVKTVNLILNCKGKVIFAGIGKSGLIARKISATFSSVGIPSFFCDPAQALHGDMGQLEKNDILIIFYGLQPNYVRDTLFDKNYIDDKNPLGKFRKLEDSIKLQKGDRFHIDFPEKEEEKYSILVFVAFTPRGGPQYGIGTNSFITPAPKEEELLEDD